MKKYFTTLPVCPNCFNINGNDRLEDISINYNILKCPYCGCYFRKNIKINQKDASIIFPIFNEIKLNKIEYSYADWILNDVSGKFFITWPWRNVKFLPVLMFQFLLKNPKSKIIVFTNHNFFNNNRFSDLSIPNILNSLFYLDFDENLSFNNDLGINNIFMKYDNSQKVEIHENIKKSFFNCYNNKFDLIQCFNVDYSFIRSLEEFNIGTKKSQIIFIDESILSQDMIDIINDLNPDLLISTDIDALWGEKRGRNPIFKLFALDCTMLLFSVDLKNRSFHNIGQENYFLKKWNIIPHTWDYSIILDKIEKMGDIEPSFCSSKFNEVQNFESNLKINLIECPILGKVESTFQIFNEIFPYDKLVIRTLEDLMKTPLYIKGLYEDKRVLDRNITFEYLFNMVFNLNLDKWRELVDVFDEVYDFHGDGCNPIADLLIEKIRERNLIDEKIVVLVHHYDIKGTKLILNDEFGENNILVTSWSKLNEELENNQINYAISSLFPPTTYDLLSSPLSNVDIICSPRNMVRFDFYRMNRMTENGLKPVYLLSDDANAPVLLKYCLKEINVPEEYQESINKIHEFGFSYKNIRYRQFNYPKFKKSDNAVLILNKYGQGMFLKYNIFIYILDENNKMKDFEIKYNKVNELNKKQLLINNGEYQSIGRLFFKFVIDHGAEIPLNEDAFKWHGFKDLIESMFSWVNLLNKVVNIEANNNLGDVNLAKSKVAKCLSNLELIAFHEDYFINNWLEEPQPLETEFGIVQIYEAERPKSINDLFKIYEWISNNYDDISLTNLAARRCFAASRLLKRIRNNFLDIASSPMDKKLIKLSLDFRKLIKNEQEIVDTFIIDDVKKVKIKKEAKPFEIINNPYDFVKKEFD